MALLTILSGGQGGQPPRILLPPAGVPLHQSARGPGPRAELVQECLAEAWAPTQHITLTLEKAGTFY